MNDFDALLTRTRHFNHGEKLKHMYMIFPWDNRLDNAEWRTAGINSNDLIYRYHLLSETKSSETKSHE